MRETISLDEFWFAAYGETRVAPEVQAAITSALVDAHAIVVESHATKSMLADACAIDRIVVVPHGWRFDRIDELRAAISREAARDMLGIERDRFLFLNVGVVAPHKGQAALAFAFATLAHHYPDASLVLLGDAESEYGQALRHLVDRLGLGARIRIEPTVMDPLPWYRAADAFVLPSDSETLPRTLLEAMAFELPVAGTSIAGIPELVVHGRNGLLFPARDLGALVEVLRKLLSASPEERAVLGAAASRDVRARQQPAAELEAFHALISTLSGRSV